MLRKILFNTYLFNIQDFIAIGIMIIQTGEKHQAQLWRQQRQMGMYSQGGTVVVV